jgi:hypothetical protein
MHIWSRKLYAMILKPVFDDMKMVNLNLTVTMFKQAKHAEYEKSYLLGYYATQSVESEQTF